VQLSYRRIPHAEIELQLQQFDERIQLAVNDDVTEHDIIIWDDQGFTRPFPHCFGISTDDGDGEGEYYNYHCHLPGSINAGGNAPDPGLPRPFEPPRWQAPEVSAPAPAPAPAPVAPGPAPAAEGSAAALRAAWLRQIDKVEEMKNDDRPADEIQKATDECNRLKEEYHAASKKETRQKNKKDKQAELKNDLEREPLYADFDPVRYGEQHTPKLKKGIRIKFRVVAQAHIAEFFEHHAKRIHRYVPCMA